MMDDVARQGTGNEDRLFRDRAAWMGRVLRCGERKMVRVAAVVSEVWRSRGGGRTQTGSCGCDTGETPRSEMTRGAGTIACFRYLDRTSDDEEHDDREEQSKDDWCTTQRASHT